MGIGEPLWLLPQCAQGRPPKPRPCPWGRQRQLVVLSEETHVVGWGFMVMWSLRDLVGLLQLGSGAAGRPEGLGGGA